MQKKEYIKVCDAVLHGANKTVEHSVTHRHGKVVTCQQDRFEVEVDGERRMWAPENCQAD